MKFFEKLLDRIGMKSEDIILEKWRPIFKTTDGIYHTGITFRWIKSSGLLCSVEEYLMIGINSDGYIYDEDYIMYPLTNILFIEWEKVNKVSIADNFQNSKLFLKTRKLNY